MYNGQIVRLLLDRQNKRPVDLLIYLGKKQSGGSAYINSLVDGNPTARTLEKVADFFGVSMDAFFVREKSLSLGSTSVVGNGNAVGTCSNVVSDSASQNEKIKLLESLINDKDKRIETLEAMIELLKHGPSER
jgi:transcriptional regulator with XRE-family HTH domain